MRTGEGLVEGDKGPPEPEIVIGELDDRWRGRRSSAIRWDTRVRDLNSDVQVRRPRS